MNRLINTSLPAFPYTPSTKKSKTSVEHRRSISIDEDTPPGSRTVRPSSTLGESDGLAASKSIPLVTISRSPSPFARQRSAAQSEDEDDYDYGKDDEEVLSRPLVTKPKRAISQDVAQAAGRGLFRRGGLGYFLFGTNAGWNLYVGLLVFWVGGCQFGLLLINRFILWTGTYKFPYPLTMTLLQLVITHLLLLGFASLTRGLGSIFKVLGLGSVVAPSNAYSRDNRHQGFRGGQRHLSVWTNIGHWLSHNSGGIAGGGLFEFEWCAARHILPLAVVLVAKIVLSNLSYAYANPHQVSRYSVDRKGRYAVLPVYQVSRIGVIPISLLLTAALGRTTLSVQTLSASLIATLNLLMASIRFQGVRAPWESIVAGVFSSLFVALYPILLLRTYQKLVCDLVPQGHVLTDLNDEDSTSTPVHGTAEETRAYWRILHYTSILSFLLLTPVCALSGEWRQIQRNCYFLDVPWFWFLIVSSSLGSWAVFSSTLLLIKATSPLTATFVAVPRSVFQLAVLSKLKLPAHAWVGSGLCWAASLWYLVARWRERPSADRTRVEAL